MGIFSVGTKIKHTSGRYGVIVGITDMAEYYEVLFDGDEFPFVCAGYTLTNNFE